MKYMSIVIPVYNAEKTIERTLASLISNKDFIKEVILVNDRSTDNTFSKIDNFKSFFDIKVIDNQGNRGPGPARKTGILAATGEWLMFVDADDCLTANSLYYINKKIQENSEMILLHTQTIYYESGYLNPEHIDFAINSCGGNVYKRDYLIKNNILPHDTLFMAEDEYFNDILIKFIQYNESSNMFRRMYFSYPMYEVHHDVDIEKSFAHSNWIDYVCKYHLLYHQYMVEFFNKGIQRQLYGSYMEGFIFAYMMLQEIMNSNPNMDFTDIFNDFKQALDFYTKTFNMSSKDLVNFYNSNPQNIENIKMGVQASNGTIYKEKISFKNFITMLNKDSNSKFTSPVRMAQKVEH